MNGRPETDGRKEAEAGRDRLASLRRLSAGIAHEINNPLGIILGYTQLLLREETPGSQRFEDLTTIERHARICRSVVEDLLHFARQSHPLFGPSDINRVLDEAVTGFRQRAGDRPCPRIERNYAENIPPLFMDAKKIRQMLVNLLLNARDAAGEHGVVRLTTGWEPERRRAIIRVSDDGCGIEPQHLSRIFDPFFTTKPTGEGTGLGLAVSYGIVKHHGGDIRVDSRPGEGTEFEVILPLETREGDGRAADNPGC
ncbi:MAG: sensor histidine kinase [Desulfococcaceae bacterium]